MLYHPNLMPPPGRDVIAPPPLDRADKNNLTLIEIGTFDTRSEIWRPGNTLTYGAGSPLDDGYGGSRGADSSSINPAGTIVLATLCRIEASSRIPVEVPGETSVRSRNFYDYYCAPNTDIRLSDRIFVPGLLQPWTANHAYSLGEFVCPTELHGEARFYECLQAGTSGANEPFPGIGNNRDAIVQSGQRFADGTVVWQERGQFFALEVVGTDVHKTSPTYTMVWCEEIK